jgi:hypothetical protein
MHRAHEKQTNTTQRTLTFKEHVMSTTLPRKAVIAISSFNGAIYPGGHKTGLFLTEALHPLARY